MVDAKKDDTIVFGRTSFSKTGLSGMTKKDFEETYTGKIDVKGALKVVRKYLKK